MTMGGMTRKVTGCPPYVSAMLSKDTMRGAVRWWCTDRRSGPGIVTRDSGFRIESGADSRVGETTNVSYSRSINMWKRTSSQARPRALYCTGGHKSF